MNVEISKPLLAYHRRQDTILLDRIILVLLFNMIFQMKYNFIYPVDISPSKMEDTAVSVPRADH